jgi:hypothetical protein
MSPPLTPRRRKGRMAAVRRERRRADGRGTYRRLGRARIFASSSRAELSLASGTRFSLSALLSLGWLALTGTCMRAQAPQLATPSHPLETSSARSGRGHGKGSPAPLPSCHGRATNVIYKQAEGVSYGRNVGGGRVEAASSDWATTESKICLFRVGGAGGFDGPAE